MTKGKVFRGIALVSCFFYNASLMAAVTSAGDTIGTSVTGTTNFTISGGTQRGANLFHSFDQFNLTSSESATFTYAGTPGSIDNIIGRILGGASSIDGLIDFNQAQLPNTNLFQYEDKYSSLYYFQDQWYLLH